MYLLTCELVSTTRLMIILLLAMLSYINSSEIDVCLVAIDFAGLSTSINR